MKNSLLATILIFSLFSCSEDDSNENTTDNGGFYALSVGNTWMYRLYEYDMDTDTYLDSGTTETVTINAKVAIDGAVFYKQTAVQTFEFGQRETTISYVRDSLGYLIDNEGTIIYSSLDFEEFQTSVFEWGTICRQLSDEKVTISVNAGTFECYDLEIYAKDPASGNLRLEGTTHYYAAEGIGFIQLTDSFVNSGTPFREKRLESFSIQQ